jgi:tRNA pseudouridine38-40 synthase
MKLVVIILFVNFFVLGILVSIKPKNLFCDAFLIFSHHHQQRRHQTTRVSLYDSISDDDDDDYNEEEEEEEDTLMATKIRYRCRVAYDGTKFRGFQLQGGRKKQEGTIITTTITTATAATDIDAESNKHNRRRHHHHNSQQQRTVQGELESVLCTRFQRLVKVVGAGRTDTGVHARGQAFHFDLYRTETNNNDRNNSIHNIIDLEHSLNRMLPTDIVIWNLQRAPLPVPLTIQNKTRIYPWNVMMNSTSKLYSYRLCLSNCMDPIDRYNRWQYDWGYQINVHRLWHVLKHFEGTNDFICFSGALEQQERKTGRSKSTIRTIQSIQLVPDTRKQRYYDDDVNDNNGTALYYRIDIHLDGALYKMVRNIVGTALDVCRNQIEESHLLDMLKRPSEFNYTRKDNPSKPAPPSGLTLEKVYYPDDVPF